MHNDSNVTIRNDSSSEAYQMMAWYIVTAIILVAGAVLNGITILALLNCDKKWNGFQILAFSLCMVDFLLSTIIYPGQLSNIYFGTTYWWSNYYFCQIFSYAGCFFTFCSTLGSCRLAAYRLHLLCSAKRSREDHARARRWSFLMLTCSYTTSLVMSAMPLFQSGVQREFFPPFGFCNAYPSPAALWMYTTMFSLWMFIPFTMLTVSYGIVVFKIQPIRRGSHDVRLNDLGDNFGQNAAQSRRRFRYFIENRRKYAGKLMCLILCFYALEHFPLAWHYLCGEKEHLALSVMALCITSLLFLSICSNAIIYAVISPHMKYPYQRLWERVTARFAI